MPCRAARLEAQSLFAIENDPVQIADREIAASLTPERARQEIEAALTANDADLAKSFVELAQERASRSSRRCSTG